MSDQSPVKASSPLKLVRAVSDSLYPFVLYADINDHLDSTRRAEQKKFVYDTMRMIDAHDFKLIENHATFELRFKYPFDLTNYKVLTENDVDQPIISRFTLPEKKIKYPSEVWRLKRWFKQAVEESGMADNVRVGIDENKKVYIRAEDLASYFKVWHHFPENRRIKMTDYGKLPADGPS